jgi:hypothetical protein
VHPAAFNAVSNRNYYSPRRAQRTRRGWLFFLFSAVLSFFAGFQARPPISIDTKPVHDIVVIVSKYDILKDKLNFYWFYKVFISSGLQ